MTKATLMTKILNFLKKHWWKVILLLMAAGVAFSGFKVNFGKLQCEKTEVKIPAKSEK